MEAVMTFASDNQLTTGALARSVLQWSSQTPASNAAADTLLQFLLRHR